MIYGLLLLVITYCYLQTFSIKQTSCSSEKKLFRFNHVSTSFTRRITVQLSSAVRLKIIGPIK